MGFTPHIPPSYSNLKTAPTPPATYQKNQQYQFNITWQDNVGTATALMEFNIINYTMSQNGNEYYRTFTDLAAGSYNYYFWANDTSGNSNKTDTFTYSINKAPSSTSLTFDKASPQTYGASITPNCSAAIGVGIPTLTMNGTFIASGSLLTLGAGNYQFNCSLAESQNYTSSENISSFVISQAVPNLTYYLNELTQNITIQYPQKVNASAYSTGGTVNIFRNGTTVTSENSIDVTLAAGYYQYEFNATGNQNYTDLSSKFLFANVNKGSSIVYTYLNNSRSNATINVGTSIYLNGTLITGEGQIQLYNNGTLINSGLSPISNLTAFNAGGLYNITTIHPETQNYTSSFETWWVNATPIASVKISNLTETYSNLTRKLFEFVILNNGTATISNIQWQFDTNDNNVINSTSNISLIANESAFVYVEYNYSSAGTYNVKANATGLSDSTIVTASLSSSVIVNSTDINKFFIKNSTGSNIAWFGDAGNVIIKGVLEQNSNFQRTDNFAFVIRNNLQDVLIIENNGSMYIDGTLFENQGAITTDYNRNDFRVKSNGNLMININETGYVFLKGALTQNGNP